MLNQTGGIHLGSCFFSLVDTSLILSIAAYHYTRAQVQPLTFQPYLLLDGLNVSSSIGETLGTRGPNLVDRFWDLLVPCMNSGIHFVKRLRRSSANSRTLACYLLELWPEHYHFEEFSLPFFQ